jgi:cell wall-associated NlpC family hydrolase
MPDVGWAVKGADALNSKQHEGYADTMSVTARAVVRVVLSCVLAAAATSCASSGNAPRPQPFPGAKVPSSAKSAEVESGDALPPPAFIATALALRGTPYLNGGSEPSQGFDCSGFVQWVFGQHGTALPREVREQFDAGQRIDRDEVKAGDLVFFTTVSRGASHVGIALGNGEFVHAPSSRGVVRVEHYTSGYWAARWIGARRIL